MVREDEVVTLKQEEIGEVYVDIKGAIKKPNVYKVASNARVIDVINLAGGLTKTGTTKNINLSAQVKNEMVIYVFSKNDLSVSNTTKAVSTVPFTTNVINYDSCITTSKVEEKTDSSLVNINTASKEELMTLNGIGASKADAIIMYRVENPYTKIEDIMNVAGIGESAFAKIKENITV